MIEPDLPRCEAELRAIRPAPVPEDFMARLQAAKPPGIQVVQRAAPSQLRLWHWLAPALALAAAVAVLLVLHFHPASTASRHPLALATGTPPRNNALPKVALQADYVQMDEELVSTFDMVATMPDGAPVRFRCRQWSDQLLVSDKTNGLEIEQDRPRVEVVPVRFETY